VAGCAVVLSAQGPRSATVVPSHDELLAEVRGLRADLNRLIRTSVRSQLLTARLQLEEQRILAVSRQLADVQNALSAIRLGLADSDARIRGMEDAAARTIGSAEQRAIQQQVALEKSANEDKRRGEQALIAQEAELLGIVNSDRARWAEFNERLEALEQSLPGSVRNP